MRVLCQTRTCPWWSGAHDICTSENISTKGHNLMNAYIHPDDGELHVVATGHLNVPLVIPIRTIRRFWIAYAGENICFIWWYSNSWYSMNSYRSICIWGQLEYIVGENVFFPRLRGVEILSKYLLNLKHRVISTPGVILLRCNNQMSHIVTLYRTLVFY